MVSVIVLGNGAKRSTLTAALAALKSAGTWETYLIADSSMAELAAPTNFIPTSSILARQSMAAALARSQGDRVIFVDARLGKAAGCAQEIIESMASKGAAAMMYTAEASGQAIDLADLSAENMVDMITDTANLWPLFCVGATRATLAQIENCEGEAPAEILAQAMIAALAQGESVSAASKPVVLSGNEETRDLCSISSAGRARMLSSAANNFKIEELFPNKPWSSSQEASAAASYHALAATFIKLGDSTGASDCLAISDQWEDSPRSLALKGIVAQMRGETLGAVANMVSSLQQYELKKRDAGSNADSSAVANPAEIEQNLNAGLAALNKQDNLTALKHFSEAVFNCDSFYKEAGIASVAH